MLAAYTDPLACSIAGSYADQVFALLIVDAAVIALQEASRSGAASATCIGSIPVVDREQKRVSSAADSGAALVLR